MRSAILIASFLLIGAAGVCGPASAGPGRLKPAPTTLPAGDAVAGREAFAKLRCNVCHSVAGEKRTALLPLRDLSRETPEAVANLIVARTELAPEALFDEMVMSAAASSMTPRELADIVAYLRRPAAASH